MDDTSDSQLQSVADPALDARAVAIGHDIFSRIRQARVKGDGSWWERMLMDFGMRDERVKGQLFRFIDVLPVLNSSRQVNAHLREYMSSVADRLPLGSGRAVRWIPDQGWLGDRLASFTLKNTRQMARRFIAATDLPEAIAAVQAFRKRKLAFTIDLLGEAVLSEAEAGHYQRQYLKLIPGLADAAESWPTVDLIDTGAYGPEPKVNVSVKLSSLYSQFDPIESAGTDSAVLDRLRPILRVARARGVFVNIDMEQYAFKDTTLRIFRQVFAEPEFRDWPDVGIAIQAYLRDCADDLRELAEWAKQRGTPVWVRLVKGAYWDFETVISAQNDWPVPVWSHKPETDANFEAQTAFLMEHHEHLRPAIASHNVRSIAVALALAEAHGVPIKGFEFQMLFGMAEPMKQALTEMGHRVRVYTPYGQLLPGMAYLVRRLLENTSNESFLKAGFHDRLPEEQLLMNPLETFRRRRSGQQKTYDSVLKGSGRMGGSPMSSKSAASGDGQADSPVPFKNEPLADFSREENRRAMEAALRAVAWASRPCPPEKNTAGINSQFRTVGSALADASSHAAVPENASAKADPTVGRKDTGETPVPLEGIRSYPLVIGGRRIESGKWIESVNPSHPEQLLGRAAAATADHASAAVDAARAVFPAWRDTPVAIRAAMLFKAADIMRRRRWELTAWAVCEAAKPWREADADVAEAIDFCEYYGREIIRLSTPQRRDVPGETNEYFHEPRGVAVTIAPWNFPLAILCGMTAAALAAGNTVVMKPAEQSPIIAAKLMEIFEEAGFPPGVVNYLPGIGEEVGPILVGHKDVAMIAFTGSRAVGLAINLAAASTPIGQEQVKKIIIEMGGKNAVIVDDDADLDQAVQGVAASAFGYAGQKCSACSRVIVLDAIYDAFLPRLIEATRSLQIGPAEDPGSFIGPVIDAVARDRILATINKARTELKTAYIVDVAQMSRLCPDPKGITGGTPVLPKNENGGAASILTSCDPVSSSNVAGTLRVPSPADGTRSVPATEGYFVPPTIFADVPPTHWIAQEEIFGPVLAVIRASDLTDALKIANGTPYALTGGLFSRSPAHIERVRREFRVGNLYINRKITGALVDRQPFGGMKLSGVGSKAGGPDYLPQFLLSRTVTENTLRHGFAPVEE